MPILGEEAFMNTVLVVDDEPAIRTLLDFALRQGGLTVRLAGSGREAVTVYREASTEIDLVLLDIRMPGLDGPQTLAALRQVDPQTRFCFLSGQACRYGSDDLLALGALRVFEKPIFDLRRFALEVQQLLPGV
jgi:two-component system OmpR family response regulator